MSNVATSHDGALGCDCKRCVRADPARFAGNRRADPVRLRFQARRGYTVHLSSESCGGYAFCGADVGHLLGAGSYDIRTIKICKCVSPDAIAVAYGLISFVAWAIRDRGAA